MPTTRSIGPATGLGLSILLGSIFAGPLCAQTPVLRDTLWEGKIKLSNLSFQHFERGRAHPYGVVKNLQLELPMEVWFRDTRNFLVVLRRDRIRSILQETSGPRYDLLAGLHPDDRDFPGGGGRFLTSATYQRAGSRYTFLATQRAVRGGVSWSLGARSSLNGSFTLPNARQMTVSATLSYSPNPPGPSEYKLIAPLPSFSGTLTKTTRKPSTEFSSWSRGD